MKKYIVQQIKNKIETLSLDWAHNYIATKRFEGSEEPKDETQRNAAKFNMEKAEEQINWLKKLLKEESK